MDHADIQRDAGTRKVESMQPLDLAGEFENPALSFLRFESCVCSFTLDLDRVNAGPLSPGLHAAARRRRLQHKRIFRTLLASDALDKGPTGRAPDFLIARQHDR